MPFPNDTFTAPRPPWRLVWGSVALVLAIVLFLPGDVFLSAPKTDMSGEAAASRAFTAASIQAGHLPLWNPYTYSGEPFLGNFLSAELYPPSLLFVFLPLTLAVNLSFLLHLLLMGWGAWFWLTRRGYGSLAAVLAGLALALSGPVFLRLYSGHLAYLCTMAWAPWLFAALEMAWRKPGRRPVLFAMACVCLQILAGGPQYVFYCAIAAGLHALVTMVQEPAVRRRVMPILVGVYLGGAMLAAAQLLPGWAATVESVRQGKLEWTLVSTFSLPMQNLFLLIVPDFFGSLTSHLYWGEGFLWETCPFIGAISVLLAGLAFFDAEHRRQIRGDIFVALLLFVLALGMHTPLLHWLYNYVPGFDKFRALARFSFPMVLMITPAIGAGAHLVIRNRLGAKSWTMAVFVFGLLLIAGSVFLELKPSSLAGLLFFVQTNTENYSMSSENVSVTISNLDPAKVIQAADQASMAILFTGTLLAMGSGALLLSRRWPMTRWIPLLILPLEMALFAHTSLGITHLADLTASPRAALIAANPGDYRVLDYGYLNNGYITGAPDIWGDDPLVLRRYAEFITFSEGGAPDHATQYAAFGNLPPSFALLRFRFAFGLRVTHAGGNGPIIAPFVLPRAMLISHYQVKSGRDAIFAELQNPNFNARQTVYLESEPTPKPQAGGETGTVKVTENNSDSLSIEADVPAPTLLFVTDLYSKDWHARALPDSSQKEYQVMPADYIVRAVPLAAGHHHLIMEYAPSSFKAGLIISAIAWLGWLALLLVRFRPPQKNAVV